MKRQAEVKKAFCLFGDTGAELGEAAIAWSASPPSGFAATHSKRFPAAVDCLA